MSRNESSANAGSSKGSDSEYYATFEFEKKIQQKKGKFASLFSINRQLLTLQT